MNNCQFFLHKSPYKIWQLFIGQMLLCICFSYSFLHGILSFVLVSCMQLHDVPCLSRFLFCFLGRGLHGRIRNQFFFIAWLPLPSLTWLEPCYVDLFPTFLGLLVNLVIWLETSDLFPNRSTLLPPRDWFIEETPVLMGWRGGESETFCFVLFCFVLFCLVFCFVLFCFVFFLLCFVLFLSLLNPSLFLFCSFINESIWIASCSWLVCGPDWLTGERLWTCMYRETTDSLRNVFEREWT